MRFEAGENEAGRRLDRVLKKIFKTAPLSFLYKIIRKDVKVNGKRASGETLLQVGDIVEIFISEEEIETLGYGRQTKRTKVRKQFTVVFEDENILVADKPFGLLTHGDATEKKNTLANQVISYLADEGSYVPGESKTFTPAPANRLDRNTTGLVLFGKTLPATRDLTKMIRSGEKGVYIEKYYLTIVKGVLKDSMTLRDNMARIEGENVTKVLPLSEDGRIMVTEVRPLASGKGFSFVEIRILTGRTHQIRAQLAAAGHPILGDRKYGDAAVNVMAAKKYGLTTQLLHAYRLKIRKGEGCMEYLKGKTFTANPPERFRKIAEDLGCCKKAKH